MNIFPIRAKAVAFVKARPAWKDYARAAQQESHVGLNHKWQGNFFDPDSTRTEFMETDTADDLPMPMSSARTIDDVLVPARRQLTRYRAAGTVRASKAECHAARDHCR